MRLAIAVDVLERTACCPTFVPVQAVGFQDGETSIMAQIHRKAGATTVLAGQID